jgi:CBS domain-containing protein
VHRSSFLPGTPHERARDALEEHEYVANFLSRHAPFDGLGAGELEHLAPRAELREFPPAAAVLEAGAEPALHVLVTGTVAVEGAPSEGGGDQMLAPGDLFPLSALMAQRPVASRYVAREPTCCIVLPAREFEHLERQHPAFRVFCARRVAGMLEQSLRVLQASTAAGIEPLLERPLREIAGGHAPVACTPETPIRAVLETLQREQVGAMIVVDSGARPVGIFTLRDMLDRVALPQPDLDAPVASVMTAPVQTLPAHAPALEAVLLMTRAGIRHVPLVEAGRIAGVVSESRLLAVTRDGIRETRAALRAAPDVAGVRAAVGEMRAVVTRLLRQGMAADAITHLVTTFNDVALQRVVELCDGGGDFPATRACWMVLGSGGRCEQTLVTDQDHAIVVDDALVAADPAALPRLLALGERVSQALADCGFPLCRGGVMAGNREWCAPLAEWRERFAGWIAAADPAALLKAVICFDFRGVVGALPLAEALRREVTAAAPQGRFLLQLAQDALGNAPPLGLVRDFVLASGGEHPNTVDLKVNGVQPFVEAARVYALASGVPASSTVERLRGSGAALRIPPPEVEGWIEAFRFIQGLRLRLNVAQTAAGTDLHNHCDPDRLNDLERRIFKESLRQARKLQARLARDFAPGSGAFGA